jgi:hypothetical protein
VSASDLQELLDAVPGGIVEYGERGSSRTAATASTYADVDLHDSVAVRAKFAEVVKETMTEDNLEYAAAIQVAAKKHPELAQAYHNRSPVSGPTA